MSSGVQLGTDLDAGRGHYHYAASGGRRGPHRAIAYMYQCKSVNCNWNVNVASNTETPRPHSQQHCVRNVICKSYKHAFKKRLANLPRMNLVPIRVHHNS